MKQAKEVKKKPGAPKVLSFGDLRDVGLCVSVCVCHDVKPAKQALNKSRGLASRAPRKQARRQQVRRTAAR